MPSPPDRDDLSGSSVGNRIPEYLRATKAQLNEAREKVREAHHRGLDPVQVCARLTATADAAVSSLWRAAVEDLPASQAEQLTTGCVLVAHGGYGRRQLAPNSDIDLMVLYDGPAQQVAEGLSQRLTSEMFDIGLDLGHSLRSIDDCLQLARTDAIVATSLLESRHVIGSQTTYDRYASAFRTTTQHRGVGACLEFVNSRRKEREKYGETVYVLEPNIKRSRGGLRDVHLLGWLWFIQHGFSGFDRLHQVGALSKFDYHRLISARDFLLRARNELHFAAPSAGDELRRHDQLKIAEGMNYRGADGLLPVEQFMRDYFRHAGFIWFITRRLSELTTRRRTVAKAIEPILSRSVTKDYRVGFTEISATEACLPRLGKELPTIMRLLTLARDHDKSIAQETWYAVYRNIPELTAEELSAESAQHFIEVLSQPEGLGRWLRRAHDLTILERIIPPFREIRCLLQFNQYHKFTVDEHTLRAVELATGFAGREDRLGQAYRGLDNKALLHLALLMHDVGKAREGDHSVVGEGIAIEIAQRLGLDRHQQQQLGLLVRRHLSMSHLAFRRDTSDPTVIADFAKLVGDPETLTMLFILTCADMAAVGPGVLNDWKISVLASLYQRTLDRLNDRNLHVEDRRNAVRTAVWQMLREGERDETEFKELFNSLPESFITSRSPKSLATALRRMRFVAAQRTPSAESIARKGVDAWGGYRADDSTVEMVAVVAEGAGRGVFASMAGALSSKSLRILSAETALLAHDLLLLRYTSEDPNPAGNAAEANRRLKAIATAIIHSVDSNEPPKLPQKWGEDKVEAAKRLSGMPNEVRIDTTLSEECAIIEVFTVDQTGLLYKLARTLHELDLIIRFATIGTSLDQVVDVFYVTRRDNSKPSDEELLGEVSRRLMAVIERD